MLSKLSKFFHFGSCRFGVQKSKESTARVSLYKDLKVPNIFTLESTFSGVDFGVWVCGSDFKRSGGSLLGMVASALRATEGTPALAMERKNIDSKGEVIDASIEFWRHDAISVESFFDKN